MRNSLGQFTKGFSKTSNWYKAMAKRRGENHSMWKGGKRIEIIECACGCGQKLDRFDSRNRLRRFIQGHQNTKYWLGKKRDRKIIEAMRKANEAKKYPKSHFQKIGLKGLITQQSSKNPTSIEKIVYDYLTLNKIVFETQKVINGKFIVDAYIPSLNLVIEVDGDYWHKLDRVVKKDKAENAYLTKCGYKLLRISENDIRKNKGIDKLNFIVHN